MLKTHALTKKKALAIVLLIGLVLLVLIGLRWYTARSPRCDLSTLEGRQAFLLELGGEIDPDSEEFRTVVVPEKLEGIMSQYNRMQLAQGYDLSAHLGESCQQYSYRLLNYPDSDNPVFVTLYIQGDQLIAGDIHIAAFRTEGHFHCICKRVCAFAEKLAGFNVVFDFFCHDCKFILCSKQVTSKRADETEMSCKLYFSMRNLSCLLVNSFTRQLYII